MQHIQNEQLPKLLILQSCLNNKILLLSMKTQLRLIELSPMLIFEKTTHEFGKLFILNLEYW